MKHSIPIARRVAPILLLFVSLVFGVVDVTPQGRGRKVGTAPPGRSGQQLPSTAGGAHGPVILGRVPGLPGNGAGMRQSCVQACNTFHRNEAQLCRGRIGKDRASCQRSINEQHHLCVTSCPK